MLVRIATDYNDYVRPAITPEIATSFKLGSADGALVNEIVRNSPAEKAGFKLGDVLVAIDGKPVASPLTVLAAVTGLAPGSPAKARVKRKGQDLELDVIVGRRPKPPQRGTPE